MAFITYAEYITINPTSDLEDNSEFQYLSEVASDLVDSLTNYKINLLGGVSEFSAFTQDKIKKATSSQIDTLYSQGGLDALTGHSDNTVDKVKIGSYEESSLNNTLITNSLVMLNGMPLSPLVDIYLRPTNLLNRSLNICFTIDDFN